MLSASITLHRRRKDGVGIKSADVVFALGDNNYTPPEDGEVWKSLVSDLTLAAGKYLWSCTKVVKTNGDLSYTGKYCLGYSLDFADAVEMYYLSTSGTTVPDPTKVSFSVTYTARKGYYLWTCVRYTSHGKMSYSTPRCDSYFPNDGTNGTSFTPKGESLGHYDNYTKLKAAQINAKDYGDIYLLDTSSDAIIGVADADTKVSKPCVARLVEEANARWYIEASSVGDAYMIGASLWVNNGTAWVQFGQIQGPAGEDGNALTLFVSPMKFTYTIDEEGNISNNDHTFYYMAFWGETLLQENNSDLQFLVSCPDGCHFKNTNDNHYAHLSGAGSGTIKDAGVETTTYNLAGKDISAYYTSAYIMLVAVYKSFVAQARIDMEGDMSLFNSDTIETKKDFIRKFESLDAKQTKQGKQITSNQTTINQTAKELDFKVSQTQYDADYQKVTDKISEIELDADGINMRVETVENGLTHKAEISATVQKDEDGNIESGVKLNADQININASHRLDIASNGCMTINTSNFKLDEYGNITCTNGNFSGTVNATAGTIGGFKINDSSIGSATRDGSIMGMLLSDDQIIFNSAFGQGIFGAYFLNGGYCYGSRVELNGGQNNIGLYINSKSSGIYHNFAIYAENGNAVVKGMNAGVKFSKATLEKNKWDPYAIDLLVNNVWHIECNGDNSILVLPTLGRVESALGNDKTYETFSIRITIIGYRSSTNTFTLTGRSTNTKLEYSTQEYPWLYNYDAENTSFAMSRGDVCELQLTYDGSVYYAQVLSLNR